MEKNRIFQARRIGQWLAAVAALTFFTGCDELKITNLTPSQLPANPSQIYTFSAKFRPKSRGFVDSSLDPQIVIDGKIHRMDPSPVGEHIYEFDYQLPAGRNEVTYYFLATYDISFSGTASMREAYSPVTTATLRSRAVLSMIANRGSQLRSDSNGHLHAPPRRSHRWTAHGRDDRCPRQRNHA